MPKYMDLDGEIEIKASINEPNNYIRAAKYIMDNPEADEEAVAKACDMTTGQVAVVINLLEKFEVI